jgi:hypothetical protein
MSGNVVNPVALGNIRKQILTDIRAGMEISDALSSCKEYGLLSNSDKVLVKSNIKLIISL